MKEKVVIITGASSGIGEACVYDYAEKGHKVVMAARNKQKLMDIQSDLAKSGKEVLAVPTDVSKEEDCKNLIDQTIQKFGKIDILINNAGISMRALFKDIETDVIKQLMEVNFWGTVYCSKYALPYLIETKGSLVGVSSIAGFQGLPGRTGYSSSKFAMHGFLETLRIENLKKGLHVMIAAPGFTSTNVRKSALGPDGKEQGESPRNENHMMSPAKVASIISNGVEKRRRLIIMTMEGKITVLLRRIVPKYIDRLTYRIFSKEPDSPLQ
ncbi:MAG: SDR family oxidoreductase [Bacteroidota bacterium]